MSSDLEFCDTCNHPKGYHVDPNRKLPYWSPEIARKQGFLTYSGMESNGLTYECGIRVVKGTYRPADSNEPHRRRGHCPCRAYMRGSIIIEEEFA